MAKKRPNIIPIIEDARHPAKYRMLVPMVDVIFADVAQPDQVRGPYRVGKSQTSICACEMRYRVTAEYDLQMRHTLGVGYSAWSARTV
jgi:hypothetical protein